MGEKRSVEEKKLFYARLSPKATIPREANAGNKTAQNGQPAATQPLTRTSSQRRPGPASLQLSEHSAITIAIQPDSQAHR
ncbi:hypothetical protein E2C01_053450 [Portunus trituberculatus]|uniref:Uncharacterized protein n=1 Tax=Portunus trituberculatus TaxID=210409 RepID=A0A5B7GH53_PORTR|nr:hypothetical protein [Portunus trituberculatus]